MSERAKELMKDAKPVIRIPVGPYRCRYKRCAWSVLGFFVRGEKAKHERNIHQ